MQLFMFICLSVAIGVDSIPIEMDAVKDNAYQCGIEASSNLIHHNPWMVFLEYYKEGERDIRNPAMPTRVVCGGTLIGSRHIVTAAHCVENTTFNRLVARLGEYDLTTEHDCVQDVCADPITRINIVKITVPDTYKENEDDIAVLELEEDAPYTDFIRPVCLPTGIIQDDVKFSAAGWGELIYNNIFSNVKKIIPLPYFSDQACRNAYKKSVLPHKMICAGGQEGIDTCRGDSGGPLTWNKGRIELWGVTSSGNDRCGTKGVPGIYTSVIDHLDWIKSVSKI